MSRKRNLIAAAAALALMGCAAPIADPRGPGVQPVETVRHGMTAEMLYRTGRYFQGLARFELARGAYEAALRLDPTYVDALNGMAVSYSLADKPQEAEEAFQHALKVEPNSARLHNNLGYHLMRAGRPGEALAHLERARDLDPADCDIEANISTARRTAAQPPRVATVAPPEAKALDGSDPAEMAVRDQATTGTQIAPVVDEIRPLAQEDEQNAGASFAQGEPVSASHRQAQPSVAMPLQLASAPLLPARAAQAWNGVPPGILAARQQAVVAAADRPMAAIRQAATAAEARTVAGPGPIVGSAAPQLVDGTRAPLALAQPRAASARGRPQLEVSNGNGLPGLARRVAGDLAVLGAPTARLTNDKPFGTRLSAIQYVAGAEHMAREVNAGLGTPLPLARVAGLERDIRVRVLLGRDFGKAPAVASLHGSNPEQRNY